MPSSKALLDTSILSAIMKEAHGVIPSARAYLAENGAFSFSTITRYEILRGLKAKNAVTQIAAFDRLCGASEVLPLTDDVVVKAAEIYADLKKRGALIGDGDILIGATALVHGLKVVTDNEDHFRRIQGLPVENWLRG